MSVIRRLAFVLVSLYAAFTFASPALAQEEVAPDSGWGTATVSVKTIASTSLVPQNQFTVTNMAVSTAGNGTVCNDFTGGTCRFTSAVDLPTGASIVGLDLEACDGAAGGSATIELWTCPVNTNSCTLASTVVSTTSGCATTSSAALNITVQNASQYYALLARITDNSIGVQLRAIRIRYKLQVSAAPGTATFPNDVPTSHPFFRFVEALAAAGISGGCGPGAFCPDTAVTRGQMAVFLATALGLNFPN